MQLGPRQFHPQIPTVGLERHQRNSTDSEGRHDVALMVRLGRDIPWVPGEASPSAEAPACHLALSDVFQHRINASEKGCPTSVGTPPDRMPLWGGRGNFFHGGLMTCLTSSIRFLGTGVSQTGRMNLPNRVSCAGRRYRLQFRVLVRRGGLSNFNKFDGDM